VNYAFFFKQPQMMHNSAIGQSGFLRYPSRVKGVAFKSLQDFGSGFKTATYVSHRSQVSVRMQSSLYDSSPIDKQATYIEKL
jgi:hypothetical protein